MCARTTERLKALAAFAVGAILIGSVEVAKAAEQRVDWTSLVNVAVRGNGLQKTGGCNGCDDATAVSRQMIRSGDGFVEFTVGEPYTFWMAGLSQSDGNVHFNSLNFALRFNANESVDVMENGQYQGGDSYYQPGDRFRIAVVGGRVRYMQNGNVIFESRQPARYPLILAVALGTMGSSLRDARMDTNNRAFTSNDYYYEPDRYARDSFNRLDRNDDGVIARREWQGSRGEFNALDANRDGVLSTREYSRLSGGGAVTGTSGQLITVNPTQRWTETGMWVEAGDMVTFDAEGSIEMSGNNGDTATPAGSRTGRRAADAPLRNQPAGILIARVGNAATFAVGDRRTVRAPAGGELFLGVNDDVLGDNRGEYRVSVTIQPR
jgi:hypothetical protein